jgi:hypothetical protein
MLYDPLAPKLSFYFIFPKRIPKSVDLFIIHTKVVSMDHSSQYPLSKLVAPLFVGTNNHSIGNG